MKIKILIVALMLTLAFVVTGCGEKEDKDNEGKDDKTVDDSNDNENGGELEGSNNPEKLVNLVFDIIEKKKVDASNLIIGNLSAEYKDNIKNPVNGSTDIYAIDRNWDGIYNDYDQEIVQSAHLIADATGTRVDDPDYGKDKTTYGCNKKNEGATVAVFLYENIYAYEIDENGEKKNEIVKKFRDLTEYENKHKNSTD